MKFFLFLEENPAEVRNWTLASAPKNNDINRDMDSQKCIFFFQELRKMELSILDDFESGFFSSQKVPVF